jgi:hypothetical protein
MNVKYFSRPPKQASGDDGPSSYVPSLRGHPVVRPSPERLRVRASLEGSLETSDPSLQPPHSALLLARNFTLSRHPLDGVSHSARRSEPLRIVLAVDQLRPLNHDRPGQTLYGSTAEGRPRLRSFTAQNERHWPDIKQPLSPIRSLEHVPAKGDQKNNRLDVTDRYIREDGGRYWLFDQQKKRLVVSSDALLHL